MVLCKALGEAVAQAHSTCHEGAVSAGMHEVTAADASARRATARDSQYAQAMVTTQAAEACAGAVRLKVAILSRNKGGRQRRAAFSAAIHMLATDVKARWRAGRERGNIGGWRTGLQCCSRTAVRAR